MKRPNPPSRPATRNEEKLLYWLLRAYIARHRQGWEEGPTFDEVFEEINRVLANHGVCGHEECTDLHKAGLRLLKRYDRKEWKAKSGSNCTLTAHRPSGQEKQESSKGIKFQRFTKG